MFVIGRLNFVTSNYFATREEKRNDGCCLKDLRHLSFTAGDEYAVRYVFRMLPYKVDKSLL